MFVQAVAAELVVTPDAARDVAEAWEWYEQQRVGLGEEFFGCLDGCLAMTRRMPEIHPKIYADFRRALVRRFPYAVFYEYESNTITLYAVFHTSRDPHKWMRRLS